MLHRGSTERAHPGPRQSWQRLHSHREEELIKAVTRLSSPKLEDKEEGELKSPGNYLILHLHSRGNPATVTVREGTETQERCWFLKIRAEGAEHCWFVSSASVPQRNLTMTSTLEVAFVVYCFPSRTWFVIRNLSFSFIHSLFRN